MMIIIIKVLIVKGGDDNDNNNIDRLIVKLAVIKIQSMYILYLYMKFNAAVI